MSSSQSSKLTKKQKKGIAFRNRKGGKGNGEISKVGGDISGGEIPVEENQDEALLEVNEVEAWPFKVPHASKGIPGQRHGKAKVEGNSTGKDGTVVDKGTKRKREDREPGVYESEKPQQKKRKAAPEGDPLPEVKTGGRDVNVQGKQRFILFVGNLKYTTSLEVIKEHFAACDPPPTIRLLTPKPSASGRPTAKSKGCAFLEFSHRNALQQALKLHQSEIEGRRINVELTAGGGGKSETRLTKVKGRNKDLDEQRKKRHEKESTTGKGTEQASILPERPQRFSTTSGIEQSAAGKRTWTVGDEEEGETHRGGRKHAKKRKQGDLKSRVWGTGVNAIPVG